MAVVDVTSIKKSDFDGFSIIQIIFGDGATNEEAALDVMDGPCRVAVISIDDEAEVRHLKL